MEYIKNTSQRLKKNLSKKPTEKWAKDTKRNFTENTNDQHTYGKMLHVFEIRITQIETTTRPIPTRLAELRSLITPDAGKNVSSWKSKPC